MKKSLSAVAMVVGALMLMASAVGATNSDGDGDHKITICHATSSETNPYTVNDIPKQQISRDKGHGNQQGVHPGDIIPPFPAGDHGAGYEAFAGQNWDAEGRAIYDAGCKVPPPPTTAPPTTAPPTTEPPVTTPPTTEPPVTTVPPTTEPPVPDNPDTVCSTEPELCEPTDEVPDIDIGTPDSVERPPTAQSPPVVVSPPTEQTAAPTQPVSTAGPATPVPVEEGELAYTGPSGMLIGTAMVGLGLLFSGLALRRRFAQDI